MSLQQWWDRQPISWQSQVWLKTRWFIVCIGRLPMYSGEPIGIWIGVEKKRKPIMFLDPQGFGRFTPKLYAWQWKMMYYPRGEMPTRPQWVSDDEHI